MQARQLIVFPEPLVAGDAWQFNLAIYDPFDETFTASLTFASGTNKLTSAASLDDEMWRWLIPGSATATLPAGPYSYALSMTDRSGNRTTADTGAVTVAADIGASGTNVNAKTSLQLMLEACDATLISLLGQEVTMATFAGQAYTLHNIAELWKVRSDLWSRRADEIEELRGNLRGRQFITRFMIR
jgi:hypothetical protein